MFFKKSIILLLKGKRFFVELLCVFGCLPNEFRECLNEVVPWGSRVPFALFILILILELIKIVWSDLVREGCSDVFRVSSTDPCLEVSTNVVLEVEGLDLKECFDVECGSH